MNHKIASILGVSALTAVALCGRDASASWLRQHSSACFGTLPSSNGLAWRDNGYAVANTGNSNNGEELMCAAPDSDTIQRNTWTTVNVEVYVNGGTTTAALCEDQWNGYGGGCSGTSTTSGVGHQTIALGADVDTFWGGSNTPIWTPGSESNFGYIYIDVGNNDDVRGIFYSK